MSDFWFGLPNPRLVYRPISEWQQLAMAGSLGPDDQLYDPVRGVWQRAADFPALRPSFPVPSVNWAALAGLGVLAALAVAASRSSANETVGGAHYHARKERRVADTREILPSP